MILTHKKQGGQEDGVHVQNHNPSPLSKHLPRPPLATMAQPRVPKFGNWNKNSNVPYTQYFDNARKDKGGGKLINPNDPVQNPEDFMEDVQPVHASPIRVRYDSRIPKSKEEPDSKHNPMVHRPMTYFANHDDGDQVVDPPMRPAWTRGGSDNNNEEFPLSHHREKSASNDGASSPAWERKGSTEGGQARALHAPERSRMKHGGLLDGIHPHVPKFGNWNKNGNIPYTQYFDNARRGKGGGILVNPNDPVQNPGAFMEDVPTAHASIRTGYDFSNPKSKEDTGRKDDPTRMGHGHYPVYEDRVVDPTWERKGSSEDGQWFALYAPERSRMNTGGRGDEIPERGAAVPRFGEWDETNPQSADGFTYIFDKVREEKQAGSAKIPSLPNNSAHANTNQQSKDKSRLCYWCCGRGRS